MPMRWLFIVRAVVAGVAAGGAVVVLLAFLWGADLTVAFVCGAVLPGALTGARLRRQRLSVRGDGLWLGCARSGLFVPWSAVEGPKDRLGSHGLQLGEGVRRSEPSRWGSAKADRYMAVSAFDARWPKAGPVADALREHRPDLAAVV